jgi:hypothetical protein
MLIYGHKDENDNEKIWYLYCLSAFCSCYSVIRLTIFTRALSNIPQRNILNVKALDPRSHEVEYSGQLRSLFSLTNFHRSRHRHHNEMNTRHNKQYEIKLPSIWEQQSVGLEMKPLPEERRCNNESLSQAHRTPHGEVTNEYGAVLYW